MANVYEKDGMVISAGCVYGSPHGTYTRLASANDGIVVEFNPEAELTQEEKARVSAFVKEADKAPENA